MAVNNMGVGVLFDVAVKGVESLDKLTSAMGSVGGVAEQLGGRLSGLFGMEAANQLKAFGAQVSGFGQKIKGMGMQGLIIAKDKVQTGVMSLSAYEEMMTSLQATSGKTSEEVVKMTEGLIQFAEVTPFEAQQVVKMGQMFARAGMDMKPYMATTEEAYAKMESLGEKTRTAAEISEYAMGKLNERGIDSVQVWSDFATSMGFSGHRLDLFMRGLDVLLSRKSFANLEEIPVSMRKEIWGSTEAVTKMSADEITKKLMEHLIKKKQLFASAAGSETLTALLTGFREFPGMIARSIMGLPKQVGGLYDPLVKAIGRIYSAFGDLFGDEDVINGIRAALRPLIGIVIKLAEAIAFVVESVHKLMKAAPWIMTPLVWGALVASGIMVVVGSIIAFGGALLSAAGTVLGMVAVGGGFALLKGNLVQVVALAKQFAQWMMASSVASNIGGIGSLGIGGAGKVIGAAKKIGGKSRILEEVYGYGSSAKTIKYFSPRKATAGDIIGKLNFGAMGNTGIFSLIKSIPGKIIPSLKSLGTWLVNIGKGGLRIFMSGFRLAAQAVGLLFSPLGLLIVLIGTLAAVFALNVGGIRDYTMSFFKGKNILTDFAGTLKALWTQDGGLDDYQKMQYAGTEEGGLSKGASLAVGFMNLLSKIGVLWDGIKQGFFATWELFEPMVNELGPIFRTLLESIGKLFSTILKPLSGGTGEFLTWAKLGRIIGVEIGIIVGVLVSLLEIAIGGITLIVMGLTWIVDVFYTLWDLGSIVWDALFTKGIIWTDRIKMVFVAVVKFLFTLFSGLIEMMGNAVGWLTGMGSDYGTKEVAMWNKTFSKMEKTAGAQTTSHVSVEELSGKKQEGGKDAIYAKENTLFDVPGSAYGAKKLIKKGEIIPEYLLGHETNKATEEKSAEKATEATTKATKAAGQAFDFSQMNVTPPAVNIETKIVQGETIMKIDGREMARAMTKYNAESKQLAGATA